MSKIKIYIITFLLLVGGSPISAKIKIESTVKQRHQSHAGLSHSTSKYSLINNYVFASVSGGYDFQLGNYKHISNFRSGAVKIDIGYELAYHQLLFQTGIGVELNTYRLRMPNQYETSISIVDTQDTPYDYTYFFNARKDRALITSLTAPILIGGRFGERLRAFYFLAGAYVNLRLSDNYHARAFTTCIGTYDRYIVPFEDMDNHAFYTNEYISKNPSPSGLKNKVQIYPHIEFGIDWSLLTSDDTWYLQSHPHEWRMRLALFAECGVINNLNSNRTDEPFIVNAGLPYDLENIQMPSLLNNRYSSGKGLHDLLVGVRFTVLFRFKITKRNCFTCFD